MNDTLATEPILNLTADAINQVKAMLSAGQEHAGKTLRVYVEKGGCSGMQYGLVFDEHRTDDLTAEFDGVPVVVDPFSAQYLRGALVDYVDALTGGGFKISNPNARQSCGCGKSFDT